jgi:hypothetical protein
MRVAGELIPGIIYADNSVNFDKTAGRKAKEMQQEMAKYLAAKGII